MPDEATAAPADEQVTPDLAASQEETPAPEADAPATDSPDIDWKDRYENLRPEHTRATQEAAEFRRLADAARRGDTDALDALGIPYETQDDDDDFVDPDEKLRREFEELKNEHLTAKQQAEQAQLQEQEATYIAEQIDALEKKAGIELDDEAVDFVIDRARSNRGQDGAPNVEAAFKGFTSVLDTHQERYLKSKKDAPKAPVGGPGEEKFDPTNDDERLRAMAREFEAAEGSD